MSESSAGPEMVRTGIYWRREVHDLARSGYVADLDADRRHAGWPGVLRGLGFIVPSRSSPR